MTQNPSAHPVPVADRVPMKTRIGWGFGGIADNYMMNILSVIFLLLYVNYFKMPAALAAIAFMIPRFVDMFTDPIIGNISDNTRSRWGRRRPYMIIGVILSAILLPFFWTPIGAAGSTVWYQNPAFMYVSVIGIVFGITYAMYSVPYTALGYELTQDYDEKTRVLAWRMYIGLFGSMTVPWVYKLSQMDQFKNEAHGAFWVSVAFGVVIIITGLIPVLVCKEREDVQKQETVPLIQSFKATMTNRPFVILSIAYVIILMGIFSAGNLVSFVNIYYVCGGNKDFGALLMGVCGTAGALVSYVSMFLIAAVSSRFEKRTAMRLGLLFALIGIGSCWITMDPRWPLAQLISTIIGCMGLQGCWLMVSSMVADVCDEDELKSGLRREGMFGAVNGFTLKGAMTITAAMASLMLGMVHFDATETELFEERTTTHVIEPVRNLQSEDPVFAAATQTFSTECDRFVELSEDKSAISGNKWTVLGRLLQGHEVYYSWYQFKDAVDAYLAAIDVYAATAPSGMKSTLAAYAQDVKSGFMADLALHTKIGSNMKALVIGFQVIGFLVAIIILAFYPINRARSEETRRKLEERKMEHQKTNVPV